MIRIGGIYKDGSGVHLALCDFTDCVGAFTYLLVMLWLKYASSWLDEPQHWD